MDNMKRQLLTVALLLTPICTVWLHAQENKHAQAMHTAFIETLFGKYPKNITAKWTAAKDDSTSVFWEALDGGGSVPKEKIHFVKLSENSGHFGPLYLDGHRFTFRNVPDDPTLPLRHILNAFDEQSPYASSYYSYVAGDEQATFPGISITFGEEHLTFPLKLEPEMNVRIIGFKDDDGFRSTYLLSWLSLEEDTINAAEEHYINDGFRSNNQLLPFSKSNVKINSKHKYYHTYGIIYEFHCPKLPNSPQFKASISNEYLERTNTELSVARNMFYNIWRKEPQQAQALITDTLQEKEKYKFHTMVVNLYNSPETPNLLSNYGILKAKLRRMLDLSRNATLTELQAISHTLNKEVDNYPFLFSHWQADYLNKAIDTIAAVAPEELKLHIGSARTKINAMRNPTEDIDSFSLYDQDFLNENFWWVNHKPIKYNRGKLLTRGNMLTARGEHYSGDTKTSYFEVDVNEVRGFYAACRLHGLRPGRYRVSAVVRAEETRSEHSGVQIFAESVGIGQDVKTYYKEIPAMGKSGGNVWFSALQRWQDLMDKKNKSTYNFDSHKIRTNGGIGYGWNRIYLDDITVSDGVLTYGISLIPETMTTYGGASSWFSACDFIVERIGE